MIAPKFYLWWTIVLVISLSLAGCSLPFISRPTAPAQKTALQEHPTSTQASPTILPANTPLRPLTTVSASPLLTATRQVVFLPATQTQPPKTSPPAPKFTQSLSTSPSSPDVITGCDRAAPGVPFDLTIPDDSPIQAGESFTKIWRLENVGSCTWTEDYSLSFFSGDSMDAPLVVPLLDEVAPGDTVDLAVDMIAPLTAGTHQGNWKLLNENEQWFGIGPNGTSAFWVRIAVIAPPTFTPTPTLTPTASATPSPTMTPTATLTSTVAISGPITVTLVLNDRLDLDQLVISPADGNEDLIYESSDDGGTLRLSLVPLAGTELAQIGQEEPVFASCQELDLSPSPVALEDLVPGDFLCFLTKLGTPGWIYIQEFSGSSDSLILQLFQWPRN